MFGLIINYIFDRFVCSCIFIFNRDGYFYCFLDVKMITNIDVQENETNKRILNIFDYYSICSKLFMFLLLTGAVTGINIICLSLLVEPYSKICVSIVNFVLLLILFVLYKLAFSKRRNNVEPHTLHQPPASVTEPIEVKIGFG